MPGKSRFNAMLEQLEQLGGLEWVTEQMEDGVTLLTMSEELTRRSGSPISRYMLNRWIDSQPDGEAVRERSRTRGAEALVDQAAAIVHSTDADRDQIALAKLRSEEMHKRAGWQDRNRFGTPKDAGIVINVQSLHLDALRARASEQVQLLHNPPKSLTANVLAVDADA